jgi:hypothetical protein
VFQKHPNEFNPGAVQARLKLNEAVEVSVVGGGRGVYGDGVQTFEVAAFDASGNFIKLAEVDDVLGWRTAAEVTEIMADLQSR